MPMNLIYEVNRPVNSVRYRLWGLGLIHVWNKMFPMLFIVILIWDYKIYQLSSHNAVRTLRPIILFASIVWFCRIFLYIRSAFNKKVFLKKQKM